MNKLRTLGDYTFKVLLFSSDNTEFLDLFIPNHNIFFFISHMIYVLGFNQKLFSLVKRYSSCILLVNT